jgi:preprotein translocase SecE subunit
MRVLKVANRTIDKNKGSLAAAGSSGLPDDEPDDVDADRSADDLEPAETPEDAEQQRLPLAEAPADDDLRISGGALVARPAIPQPARGAGVPAFLLANPFTRFLAESYIELRKVTWPDSREAWNMALVVIGVSLAVAAVLGAADFGLNHLVGWVASLSGSAGASPAPTPTP